MVEKDVLIHAAICLILSFLWIIPLTYLHLSFSDLFNPKIFIDNAQYFILIGLVSGVLLSVFLAWYFKNPSDIAASFSGIGLLFGWFILKSLYYLPIAALFLIGLGVSRKAKPKGFFNGWNMASKPLAFLTFGIFIAIAFWGYTNYDIAKQNFEETLINLSYSSMQNINISSLNLSISKTQFEQMVKNELLQKAQEYANMTPGYQNMSDEKKQELVQYYYSQLLNASYEQYLSTSRSISKALSEKLSMQLPKEQMIKIMEGIPPIKIIITYLPIFLALIIAPLYRLYLYIFTQPFVAILWIFWGEEVIE